MNKNDVKKAAEAGDVAPLAEGARSGSKRVRKAALTALVHLGTPEAVDAIAEIALTEYNQVLQGEATEALTESGDPRLGPARQRQRWLQGEGDKEPDTAVTPGAQVPSGRADGGLQLVAAPAGPAADGGGHGLTTSGGDHDRAGGTIDLVVSLARWPDPKLEAVTITVWYEKATLFQHEVDPLVHTTLVGAAFAHPSLSMGQRTKSVSVASVDAFPSEIEDGRLAARFTIPRAGPWSVAGVIGWHAQAEVVRSRGTNQAFTASFQVDPEVPAGPPAGDPDDWILRLCEAGDVAYEDRLAPSGERRRVQLQIDTPVVLSGGAMTGTVTVDAGDGDDPPESVRVGLECWRGSELNRTCHRMVLTDTTTARPGVPFEIAVPTSVSTSPCACGTCPSVGGIGASLREAPVPSTFRGADLKKGLDDIRWRVVASAAGEPVPGNPWWTSAEVIVAPSDR